MLAHPVETPGSAAESPLMVFCVDSLAVSVALLPNLSLVLVPVQSLVHAFGVFFFTKLLPGWRLSENSIFGPFSIVISTLYSSLIFTTNELHCQSPHTTRAALVVLLPFM